MASRTNITNPTQNNSETDATRREFVSQGPFIQMLCRERKRAERSGKSFLLALLDTTDILRERGANQAIEKIPAAVLSAIRDSDLSGWYEDRVVAGIIFTEIDQPNRDMAQSALLSRLTASLYKAIHPQYVDRIRISFLFFPQDGDGPRLGYSADEKFYPELMQRVNVRRVPELLKRSMDVAGSALALVMLSPVFAGISLAIKLSSKGPVLFKQERVGRFGVPFTLLKFRSMRTSNDASIHKDYIKQFIAGQAASNGAGNEEPVYKITDDPRITLVGKFLRKSSLDELPQLWNVLIGEMSLVGPRPPIPYELESYEVWHLCRVLEAKPGITGLWQVNGRSRLTFDEMVRLDLRYARTWSTWMDIKILLRTPRAIFSGKGAY